MLGYQEELGGVSESGFPRIIRVGYGYLCSFFEGDDQVWLF